MDSLALLQKHVRRRVLLVSLQPSGVHAVLAERSGTETHWRITHETASAKNHAEGLEEALSGLPSAPAVSHVILAADACRILLLDQTVPTHLKPRQVGEMLRWEMDASLAAETEHADPDHVSAPGHVAWETGHAGAGTHQTAVAGFDPAWLTELRQPLDKRGLTVMAVVPSLALGWAAPAALNAAHGAVTVAQHWSGQCALSIFERGRLEFFATYPATDTTSWSKNLIADARSFNSKKVVVLRDDDGTNPDAIAGLPEPEDIPPHWLWRGLLQACGLEDAGALAQSIPVVVCLTPPVELWKRPAMWWAAAAALVLIVAIPKLSGWAGQVRALEQQKAAVAADIQATLNKLRAFDHDAEQYAQLEAQLKKLQTQIEQAAVEAEKPGRAACAQVAYVREALEAIAQAFASRVRVKQFRTDFQGRILIQGESSSDALVLDALEEFYTLLAQHPVKPAAVTTTKENAPVGRLLFVADDAASPVSITAAPPPLVSTEPAASNTPSLAAATVPEDGADPAAAAQTAMPPDSPRLALDQIPVPGQLAPSESLATMPAPSAFLPPSTVAPQRSRSNNTP